MEFTHYASNFFHAFLVFLYFTPKENLRNILYLRIASKLVF